MSMKTKEDDRTSVRAVGAALVAAQGQPQGLPLQNRGNKARMSMKTKEDDKKSSSPEVEKSRSRGVEKVKNRMLDRGMPVIGDAAVGSSTSELLDFSTFLRERTLNVYENKAQELECTPKLRQIK